MKHFLKYIVTLLLIFGSAFDAASADKISKAQKEAIKTVKKSLGAKSVETFSTAPEAPFYKFLTKEGKWGIADQSANVLLQPEYDNVLYFPAFDGSATLINVEDSKGKKTSQTISLPTQPTREAMWGITKDKGTSVFDAKGNLMALFPNISALYFGNYVFLPSMPFILVDEQLASESFSVHCVNRVNRKSGRGHGILVRSDGTIVVPEIDDASVHQNDPYLVYEKISDDNVSYFGMKVIDDRQYKQAPDQQNTLLFNGKWVDIAGDNKFISEIPPIFYNVDCKNGVWVVSDKMINSTFTNKVYEPGVTKSLEIRDPGEVFFSHGQFDDVIAYYSDEGLEAPWASFYSAEALMEKCSQSQFRFELAVQSMENGGGLPKNEAGVISDVDVIRNMRSTSLDLYNRYINSGETEFLQQARSGKNLAEHYLESLNDYITRYNNVRSHAAMVTSQQEAQQAALMSQFLDAFSRSLQSSSGRKSTSSSSYSASGTSTVSSGGGSSSSSTDNSSRKAFLKGQIADWRNKLKKAEQSYQQAMGSGDDSWQKKRVLESKQKTIDECANMIRQYESELNSLK